ncbi:hypothetical protein AVV44_gp043 [Cronobacter phage S13]|jgi:hypothetical protein|uniref:DUF7415 domain-containing protein n=1 Tax=Cronobacter phage LPCS28 TaxID=2924885 RepID=A0AAE9G9D1_9CAUD|nr:hypothetical protein AVV44_gp043 [Cronobacter phage S13]YP_010665894.1 hypothetical protein PQB73_gp130 [Cronobacter phage LPCS28]AIA64842.1 hypothetical protein S13_043 [Cronobacter phage S13]UNY47083.1 hypothetical protein EHEKIMEA_00201 [Cronobacter phage LPCS28]
MNLNEREIDVIIPSLVDFNVLSKLGLIYKINKEVLHPLGLALGYDPDVGDSDGAIISDDDKWEYSPELDQRGSDKYEAFLKQKIDGLTTAEIVNQIKARNAI